MPNKIYNNYHKKCVFKIICDKLRDLDLNEIKGLKTQNGNTQNSERITINIVKNILDKLNFNYTEASSQQPYDFRNILNIGLNIEVKKTDGFNVFFNDTCPSTNAYYIIIFTGKKFKRPTKKDIKPQFIFINGYDLIKDDIYLLYGKDGLKEDMEYMKNKWGRKGTGGNACKFKHMGCYPRPTYQSDIKYLLDSEYSHEIKYKLNIRGPGDIPKPKRLFNQFFNNHLN
jgi:hypothetical protein